MYLHKFDDNCFHKLLISHMFINNIKKFSVFLCDTYFKYLYYLITLILLID